MDIPPLKKKKTLKSIQNLELQTLIESWPSHECLNKTTSADYERNDKRAAAVEAFTRALETRLAEETFTGRSMILIAMP